METLTTLSPMERVLFLRKVPLFAELPPPDLLPIASIAKEVVFADGERIAARGDPGDVMHVIVDGSVDVVAGDARVLATRAAGDVVGEMALLDAEPRSASVTAVEDTQLFRLDQEPFYELMADRVEVAHGIIRMLTRYVRARIRDVTALDVRVRELEQAVHAQQVLTIS